MIDYGELEALRTIGQPRSSHWPAVEKAHLAESPACACCTTASSTAKQQVHHVWPFHYCIALGRPDLELDPRNLITLCEGIRLGVAPEAIRPRLIPRAEQRAAHV